MEPFACIRIYPSSSNLKACHQVIQTSVQLTNYCTGLCHRTCIINETLIFIFEARFLRLSGSNRDNKRDARPTVEKTSHMI